MNKFGSEITELQINTVGRVKEETVDNWSKRYSSY